MSSLGGGPGSDIVAILKYLDEQKDVEPVKHLTCYLLDKEQAWSDTWTQINEFLNPALHVNANCQLIDITKAKSGEHQTKFLQADVFTLIYFVSEVWALDKGGVANSWYHIFNEAKSGALFLYIDNGHAKFNSYFDEQWKSAGLKRIASGDDQRWTPRRAEKASQLDAYTKKFGQNPKLRAQVSYRILRKS